MYVMANHAPVQLFPAEEGTKQGQRRYGFLAWGTMQNLAKEGTKRGRWMRMQKVDAGINSDGEMASDPSSSNDNGRSSNDDLPESEDLRSSDEEKLA